LLVHTPEARPEKFGSTCLAYAEDISHRQPVYGVLLNVWNNAAKLRVVLTQLLKLTREPWELVVLFDGCEDSSYQVAMDLVSRFKSWPRCGYTLTEADEGRVWKQGVNLTSYQGDIGRECWHRPSSLVSIRFINNTGVGLYNTASDNLKMLASKADYYILVDDDQLMTVDGWNVKGARPLLEWPDVISASMRCAHGFPTFGQLFGTKCRNTSRQQPPPPERCAFVVADSGNRGPLFLRASFVRQLGFLDEVRFAGHLTGGE
jgi:hypothetical protein